MPSELRVFLQTRSKNSSSAISSICFWYLQYFVGSWSFNSLSVNSWVFLGFAMLLTYKVERVLLRFMIGETEEPESEPEKEIPMYCCLLISYAVYYKFITIDMDRNSVDIRLHLGSTLSEDVKKAIDNKLCKEHLTRRKN